MKKRRIFICVAALVLGAGAFLGWKLLHVPKTAPVSPAPGFLEDLPQKDEPEPTPAPKEEDLFTLYDQATGETVEVPGRELIPVAVACEMDLSAPEEALKAQAVACYTLFCRKRQNKETIPCDSQRWQVWTTPEQLRARWGEDADGNLQALKAVIDPVYGQRVELDGQPILAAYCAISAGATETSGAVWQQNLPYLQTVASPGDAFADGYLSTVTLTEEQFRTAAEAAFPDDPPVLDGNPAGWLTVTECSPGGYVEEALLGGKTISGAELRAVFGLRSAAFSVEYAEEGFRFTTRGWGHGVGMSQAGACFLAKRGLGYEEILAWYYPGTELVP